MEIHITIHMEAAQASLPGSFFCAAKNFLCAIDRWPARCYPKLSLHNVIIKAKTEKGRGNR